MPKLPITCGIDSLDLSFHLQTDYWDDVYVEAMEAIRKAGFK
jgi:hypothetical protein